MLASARRPGPVADGTTLERSGALGLGFPEEAVAAIFAVFLKHRDEINASHSRELRAGLVAE